VIQVPELQYFESKRLHAMPGFVVVETAEAGVVNFSQRASTHPAKQVQSGVAPFKQYL
jgi:hypothetical protein